MTLAGLAEELKFRGLHEAEVVLAVGLPLAWVKSQAADWRAYLMQEKELDFMFQKERYKVHLCGVEIFPQGLAAVHNQGAMPGMNMLVDIGNGTMSILEIHDGRPIEKSISTEVFGVHHCMEKIQKELSKRGGVEVPEMLIEPLLRNGIGERTDDVAMVTKRIAESYTEEIMKKLAAHGYKEDLVHLYIIGGGGCLLRHFSDLTEKGNGRNEAADERKNCMRKTYKSSNVRFCMEDENQRRTWEYLQSLTRKDSSYGKALSDAFVLVLDGKVSKGDAGEKEESCFSLLKAKKALSEENIPIGKMLSEEAFYEGLKVIEEHIEESVAERISKM